MEMDMELADVVYLFYPGGEKGIMFYDQSPRGIVGELTGTLPEGKFWSSGEKKVEWDENINGPKKANIPVNEETSVIINQAQLRGRNNGTYGATTIMVSQEVFVRILQQLAKPTKNSDNGYTIIDLGTEIISHKENEKDFNGNELDSMFSKEVTKYNVDDESLKETPNHYNSI